MTRRLFLLPMALGLGCLVANPEYKQTSAGGMAEATSVGSSGEGVTSGSTTTAGAGSGSGSGASATSSPPSDTDSRTSGSPEPSTSSDSSTTQEAPSTSSASSTGGGETGQALEPIDLGQPCAESDGCAGLGPNIECCEADQCLDTCMVPCAGVDECPFDGMGCEHGYCLFPCDEGDDDDCVDWPSFTCQHGGAYCESN